MSDPEFVKIKEGLTVKIEMEEQRALTARAFCKTLVGFVKGLEETERAMHGRVRIAWYLESVEIEADGVTFTIKGADKRARTRMVDDGLADKNENTEATTP